MKSMLTRALPAAAIAAVVAMSASTGAVAAALITGADIKDGSVASRDIKNQSLTGKDVKDGALTGADINAGTLGDLKGPAGAPGVSQLEVVAATSSVTAGSTETLQVTCPAGKTMLGLASDWVENWNPTAERLKPDGNGEVYGHNTTGVTRTLRGTATCAKVG